MQIIYMYTHGDRAAKAASPLEQRRDCPSGDAPWWSFGTGCKEGVENPGVRVFMFAYMPGLRSFVFGALLANPLNKKAH